MCVGGSLPFPMLSNTWAILSPGRNPSLLRNLIGDFTVRLGDEDAKLSFLASMHAFLIMQTASSLLSLFLCEP